MVWNIPPGFSNDLLMALMIVDRREGGGGRKVNTEIWRKMELVVDE